MSFEAFMPPPPGNVTAVLPGPGAAPVEALSPVLADARAGGRRIAVVRASVPATCRLTAAAGMRAGATLPTGAEREAWLRPLPELAARLERPWSELGQGERYLLTVARARLDAPDLLVLELPSSRLPGPRVLQLIQDLASEGMGLLWIERRLRLIAAFEIDAWLVDDGEALGPLPAPMLLEDERAWRLCFGGTLNGS